MYRFGLCLTLALTAGTLEAAEQRSCLFERHILDGISYNVTLPVEIRFDGPLAGLAVSGGTYPGQQRRGANGTQGVSILTPISTETITISSGGEALWSMDFQDGGAMAYVGFCAPARAVP